MSRALVIMAMFILTATLVSCRLEAQRNCDLGQPKFDNPFLDGAGWVQPRIIWHVFHAELAFVVSDGLHRITRLPRRITALVPPLASLAFHIRGVRQHRYAFDGRDWAFDIALRSGPLLATIPNPLYGVGIYAASYASLFCFAHP